MTTSEKNDGKCSKGPKLVGNGEARVENKCVNNKELGHEQ